jgi:protein TonB
MKVPVKIINRENVLKKNYLITMQLGLIMSLGIGLFAVKMEYYPSQQEEAITVAIQEEVYMEEIIQTKQEIKAPPPPRPTVPVEVPNDEIIEDEIIEIDAEFDLGEVFELPPPPRPIEAEEEEEEIFVVVEQAPELIGGLEGLQSRIVYPEIALKAGIEGRVILQFVIDRNGNVNNPVVVRGIGGGCDEEALRAIRTSKFTPGLQRGRPVSVRYSLPVTFKFKKTSGS